MQAIDYTPLEKHSNLGPEDPNQPMTLDTGSRPSLLTLPSELRNTIYEFVFAAELREWRPRPPEKPNPFAIALQLHPSPTPQRPTQSPHPLRILQTCHQIHREAHLLAISMTTFHLAGHYSDPSFFSAKTSLLSTPKLHAIRRITLTTRISHLRALNEAWGGLPFGTSHLRLERLVLTPQRPDASDLAYAEIADLSQCHTLAYILGETFKSLRNVTCVEVRNGDCFNELVWRLVYRSLVHRLWRWGGCACGIRFESGEVAKGEQSEREMQWFRAWFNDSNEYSEVGEELRRLVGQAIEVPVRMPNGVGT